MIYQIHKPKRNSRFEFLKNMSLTTKIISVNVVFFILAWILLSLEAVSMDWIAIMPAHIFQGKYIWTFLTSMFMHGGFFHLFANMISLFFVGSLIEKILGRKRYFNFYMIAGIFASLLFVLSAYVGFDNPLIPAVGASGAIFGLVGLLIILTPDLKVYMMFIPIPIKMKYAAPGMLVLIWIISASAGLSIGNVAHLGGALFGLTYGLVLKSRFPRKVAMIKNHFR